MGVGAILLIAAFILTLIAAFARGGPGPAPWVRYSPHLGWLGISLYFLSQILR